MSKEFIRIGGAREHNLKNLSLSIPRDKLVVFTGLSGSGKSSLAFGLLIDRMGTSVLIVSSGLSLAALAALCLLRQPPAPSPDP